MFISNIKRIIFERVEKFDGFQVSLLSISHLKQIAGRAGRFSSDHGLGLVNALDEDDLKYVQATMPKTPHNITHAGIGPFYDMLEKFSKILPDHSLSLLLVKKLLITFHFFFVFIRINSKTWLKQVVIISSVIWKPKNPLQL